MNKGYVKLWRGIQDSAIITNPTALQLFIYFLTDASRTKRTFNSGGKIVTLHPGQLIIGRKIMAKALRLSEQKIRTGIKFLEKLGTITRNSTNKYTLVTLVKWHVYQNEQEETNQQVTSNQPAGNQQLTTTQDIKKLKKKEEREEIPLPPLESPESSKLSKPKKPSSQKKLLKKAKTKIFESWKKIADTWGIPGRTGGKAAHLGIERYIRTQADADRAVKAMEMLIEREPSRFHTQNASNFWSLEWLFRAMDSKRNPVDRIQDIIDGRLFEDYSQDVQDEEPTKRYSPREQKRYGCDEFGNLIDEVI